MGGASLFAKWCYTVLPLQDFPAIVKPVKITAIQNAPLVLRILIWDINSATPFFNHFIT
jgi:hypothetical protein